MSSKRETILARVATVLAGTTEVGTRIYRSRVVALQRSESPALVIEPVSDSAERQAVGRTIWRFVFRVLVVVREAIPDQAADDVVVDVHAQLMADATLSGMLVDFQPISTDWEIADGDQPVGVVKMQFLATYQTTEGSLSA